MKPLPKIVSVVTILATVATTVIAWAETNDPNHALLAAKAVSLIGLIATVLSSLAHSLTGQGGSGTP